MVLGHFYPVIESPEKTKVLVGAAIKGSSHYVVTGYDGYPSKTKIFDELIIANEFSISPAFIITISKKTKKSLLKTYKQYHKVQGARELLSAKIQGDQVPGIEVPLAEGQILLEVDSLDEPENPQILKKLTEIGSEQELSHLTVTDDQESDSLSSEDELLGRDSRNGYRFH